MQIAAFCTATGLGRDTVRFYLKRGLLTPTFNGNNGYADFDDAQVERALVIRASQALGFTLKEIITLSAEWEAVGDDLQWQLRLMQERLASLDTQAKKLRAMRSYFLAKIRWLEAGAKGPYPQLPMSLRNSDATECRATAMKPQAASPETKARRGSKPNQ